MKIRPVVVALAVTAAIAPAVTPAIASGVDRSATHPSVTVPTPGPGWLVAVWNPHPRSNHQVRYLELVSPEGNRFILYRIHNLFTQLDDWSGDGTRVLYVTSLPNGSSVVSIVDLATGGVEHSFTVHGSNYLVATFTRPEGRAVFVDTGGLTRYSLSGAVAARFPAAVRGLGRWTDSWLESPDGRYLVLGTKRGLAFFSNDGTLLARTAIPNGTYCQPVRWWAAGKVLATCQEASNPSISTLYEVPTSGAAPTQFVRIPHNSFGYSDAYQIGAKVFLQGAVSCGLPYLAELRGTTAVQVTPHLRGGGAAVVATTSSSLALLSADGCTGQNFVSWYTPATNSVQQVLGAPLSSGSVSDVISYSNPISTGSPASNPFR
jgi:hypothetical protein